MTSSSSFWMFARRMLRRRVTVVAALVMAFISAMSMGAGLLGMVAVLRTILSGDGPTLPERLTALSDKLPIAIPASWIAALPADRFETVAIFIGALGMLTVFGALANFLHAYLSLTITLGTIASIRREVFRQVLHLPLHNLARRQGDTLSRIINDTNVLLTGFNALVSKTVAHLTKGAAALATAIIIEWRLTIVAVIIAPALYIIVRKLGKHVRRASRGAMQAQARLLSVATEALQGLRVVKVYTAEHYELGRFSRNNRELLNEQFRARRARALASPLTETVMIFVFGALALVAAKEIIDGRLELPTFIGALASLAIAGESLKPLSKVAQEIQSSEAAAGRIARLMETEPEPLGVFSRGASQRPPLPRHAKSIEFKNISFTYPGAESPALTDISLTISHGETIAFVGPNGSGKTTLLSLIPRLFEPQHGKILLDGADICEASLRSLRQQIGVVTQEVVLFHGTIASNIAYAAPGASMDEIVSAATSASAHEFIIAKPDGYDAVVGDQGLTLSGGERQRLAIARAILRNPSILILDEATSMIDADSERKIGEAIGRFSAGRTCLIVAHRLSTVQHADRIVVMNGGVIEDVGAHQELLERCRTYTLIAQTQLVPPPVSV